METTPAVRNLAGRQGFEPRYADPESAVLPLDDLPARRQPRSERSRRECVDHYNYYSTTCAILQRAALRTPRNSRAGTGSSFTSMLLGVACQLHHCPALLPTKRSPRSGSHRNRYSCRPAQAGAGALNHLLKESGQVPARAAYACGQAAWYREKRSRNLLTAVGPVRFERAYYWCSSCHRGQSPRERDNDNSACRTGESYQ